MDHTHSSHYLTSYSLSSSFYYLENWFWEKKKKKTDHLYQMSFAVPILLSPLQGLSLTFISS